MEKREAARAAYCRPTPFISYRELLLLVILFRESETQSILRTPDSLRENEIIGSLLYKFALSRLFSHQKSSAE